MTATLNITESFRTVIASGDVEPLALPARSLNLNAYAERWVRSVKEECLSKVILFGERSLRRALDENHARRPAREADWVLVGARRRYRRSAAGTGRQSYPGRQHHSDCG